jgi:hypothetical protein
MDWILWCANGLGLVVLFVGGCWQLNVICQFLRGGRWRPAHPARPGIMSVPLRERMGGVDAPIRQARDTAQMGDRRSTVQAGAGHEWGSGVIVPSA